MEVRLLSKLSPDGALGKAVHALIRRQLKTDSDLQAILRVIGLGDSSAVIMAGFVDNELATINAFMPQAFRRGSSTILGFQSGFSATEAKFRGQGLWTRLMTQSFEALNEQSADFIFGFPNPVSQPLFESKLGFDTVWMSRTVLPAFASPLITKLVSLKEELFAPDFPSLLESKRRGVDDLVVYGKNSPLVFGKNYARSGIKIADIGDFSSGGECLDSAIRSFCSKCQAYLFRLEATSMPSVANFRLGKTARPVVFKAFDRGLSISEMYFCSGLADSF